MFWIAVFFFVSGLCSILYELVWLRLAMADFGVTTALVSIVLSVFMAGLGAGSWIAGWATRRYGERIRFPSLRLYGLVELAIGFSALAVPVELKWGSQLLEHLAGQVSMSSGTFYLLSGPWLALTLIPWCAGMGATIPIAMFAIRRTWTGKSERSFSFLYLANVIGAVLGAVITPALVELYGFYGTLRKGAVLNLLIFLAALALSFTLKKKVSTDAGGAAVAARIARSTAHGSALLLLFTTGLATMGMEVVWIRLYTYFIDPIVYSFALILASYLAATFLGSTIYRFCSRHGPIEQESALLWVSLALLGIFGLYTADSGHDLDANLRVVLGVAPFSCMIGFLTPMLVDRWSGGDPDRAGRAYAVNILGCILGPLLAGFVLLPVFGERRSMLLLVLPWFAMGIVGARRWKFAWQSAAAALLLIATGTVFHRSKDYEYAYRGGVTLRDATATSIATGEGLDKLLLVNGVGMTALTPITKMMAHLTLAHLQEFPKNTLVICFGMGTTFRSAMSWGIPVTVVELAPGVPKLFTYFHPDGGPLLRSPRAHLVIDDGRRFLDRSVEKFDAMVIDPPPPLEAAGSSLLYSLNFYLLAKQHLTKQGILQQWLYEGDDVDRAAITRALLEAFPYVKVYQSAWCPEGYHFLASQSPIPDWTSQQMVARMPQAAIRDLMEWGPERTPKDEFDTVLMRQVPPDKMIELAPNTPALQDDRPINEYNRLRTWFPEWMNARAAAEPTQARVQ